MNEIDFTHSGGFPLETDTLAEMQEAYNIFNKLGNVAGNKTILSGCVLNEDTNTVSDGYIYFDGKIFKFIGGTLTSSIGVRIQEDISTRVFGDTKSKNVYTKRTAVLDASITSNLWSEFKRVYPLSSALFIDEIKMFAGDLNTIPNGWYLCNGLNETVDLRGRFIAGYDDRDNTNDYQSIGNFGGEKEVTLSKAQMPNYNLTHNLTTVSKNVVGKYIGKNGDGFPDGNGNTTTVGEDHSYVLKSEQLSIPSTNVEGVIYSNGGDEAHENRPPYYTLAFIQFKGI